ncbi:DNA mismatch repair protein, putative [Babesia ovata]|uniref:DNA mismatch repair protein, putative n=1 Tax=Babesia ovata TaxID=189622 RepID=A0A2H6K6D2_9APIC|nr:DNA mismatch repair protein, putative [Babesia ovata]GBE58553.1 DNA mismatch repair protein, putative [Babesia ovata]
METQREEWKCELKVVVEVVDVLVEREHPAAAGEQRLDVDEVGGFGRQEVGADVEDVHAVEEYDEDVERGDEPECEHSVEEGSPDAVEECVHGGHEVCDRLSGDHFPQLGDDL